MSAPVSEASEEEPAVEDIVPRPDSSIVFMARRSDLRLVKTAKQVSYNSAGTKVGEVAGQTVEFRDGVLRVPREGMMRIGDGRSIDVEELLPWLADHPMCDSVEEGFWRVDATAPPLSAAEAQAIQRFSRRLDLDGLASMLDAEREGWARAPVLRVLGETIDEVKVDLAERQSVLEAEVEKRLAERTD
jgi:hypothetical protein